MTEKWKEEHDALYPEQPVSSKALVHIPRPAFPTSRVSHAAHEIIMDLEQAYLIMLGAKDRVEIDAAYENLNHRRRDLYEYLDGLEQHAGIDRTIVKRFI